MNRDKLVEAMARAIAREAGHDPDVMIPGATKEAGRIWRQFIGAAAAVLSAIEVNGAVVLPVEQTEYMRAALICGLINTNSHAKAYAAMIEASPYRSAE